MALDVMTLLSLLIVGMIGSTEAIATTVPCDETLENRVSLIQLIADPGRWDGKEVRVIGFARFEYEGDALYLSKADYLLGLSESAIGLYVPYSEYGRPVDGSIDTVGNDRQIVEVQGMFRAYKDGTTRTIGAYTGEIGPVCSLERRDFRSE